MNKTKIVLVIGIILAVLAVLTAPVAADYDIFHLVPEDSSCCDGTGCTTTVLVMMNVSQDNVNAAQASIIFDPSVVNVTLVEEGTNPDWLLWDWHIFTYGGYTYVKISPTDYTKTFGPGELEIGKMTLQCEASGVSALHFGNQSEIGGDRCEVSGTTGMICGPTGDECTMEDGTFTCEGLSEADGKAKEDIPVSGTVSGSYTDTNESDNVYESITEVLTTGNPAKNRYSYLEHKWTINVTGGSKTNVTFYLEAHHNPSSDGDDFEFAYSTDDSNYINMDTCKVTKTTDDDTYQTYEMPPDTSGTVYIRVKDTDRTKGNQDLDTIYIDHMFIRSVLAPPSYGVTVTIDEASQTVTPGNSTTYTVRVKNTGDLDASYNVVMSGTAVDETTIDVNPLNWNTGTLAPNAEHVQTVTVSTTSSTPEATYTLTATATCDQDASVNDSATSELVVSSAEYTDDKAKEDLPVKGTVACSYTDTHTSNDMYESITEVLSGGKPATRYSLLEHKWTIDVTGGSKVTFYLEAYHSPSSDGDDFEFAYSTDDSNYINMDTCKVTKTADDDTYQTYEMTPDTSGTVYIRVKDTNRNAGNQDLDTIHIDHMFIRSESGPPSYGVTVTIDEASQTVKPGESTNYTVRVKNTGDLDASYSVVMSGTAVEETTIGVSPLNWNTDTLVPNAEDVQIVTVSTNSSTLENTYTLTATATCDQDTSVTDSATSELVVSSAANTMHVYSIDMWYTTAGPNYKIYTKVKIVGSSDVAVTGATVYLTTTLPDGTSVSSSDVTVDDGTVEFTYGPTKKEGTYTSTVTDVAKDGWTYVPEANVETSETLTVP